MRVTAGREICISAGNCVLTVGTGTARWGPETGVPAPNSRTAGIFY